MEGVTITEQARARLAASRVARMKEQAGEAAEEVLSLAAQVSEYAAEHIGAG